MISLIPFEFNDKSKRDGWRSGYAVRLAHHRNAKFLATSLLDFARQQGLHVLAQADDVDQSFTVRIYDNDRLSAQDVIEQFIKAMKEAKGELAGN